MITPPTIARFRFKSPDSSNLSSLDKLKSLKPKVLWTIAYGAFLTNVQKVLVVKLIDLTRTGLESDDA